MTPTLDTTYWLIIGILWFAAGACVGIAVTARWFWSEEPMLLTDVQKDLWDDEFLARERQELDDASIEQLIRAGRIQLVDHDGDADTREPEYFPGHQPHPFCKHTRSIYP